jgi:hypothetical protein
MMSPPDITVTVNFHREGELVGPALASLSDLVNFARAGGVSVETQAVLDCADEVTSHHVALRGSWIDKVEEVSFGDLGLSRNAGVRLANGRFLGFLDGDDLWGEHWLRAAFTAATTSPASPNVIWHPEHLLIFSESDFDKPTEASYQSFHSVMHSSDTPDFDPLLLVFHNLWSANAFASREIHVRFPYRAADRNRGFGIEDWSWNMETLGAGLHHNVVPGTVHLIRKKRSASLDQANQAHGLLPYLPASFVWGQKWP